MPPRAAASLAALALGLCLLGSPVPAPSAAPATRTEAFPASADTFIRAGMPNTNQGAWSYLRVRALGDNRALVRFDQDRLQAVVGSDKLISATLTLRVNGAFNWGAEGGTISLHRLTASWLEGDGVDADGETGVGSRGTGSGATWNCAIDANIANHLKNCSGATGWEMDRPSRPDLHPWVDTATDSAVIHTGLTGSLSFDVTADVAAWLSGDALNDGWIVKKDTRSETGRIQLRSREAGDGPQLTLVIKPSDSDPPQVSAEGLSLENQGGDYVNGQGTHSIYVAASDSGTGVARIAVGSADGTELASSEADCSASCPAEYSETLNFDTSAFGEGAHPLVATARDQAGNVGVSEPWTLWVDQTPPSIPGNVDLLSFDTASGEATVGWDDSEDPELPDGSPGSGPDRYDVRYQVAGGDWTDWSRQADTTVIIPDGHSDDTLSIEARAVDVVGNASDVATASFTLVDTQPRLDDAQVAQATGIAESDSRVADLVSGRSYNVKDVTPWLSESDEVVGAGVSITWNDPASLTYDWPSDAGVWHYTADNATGLYVMVSLDCAQVMSIEPDDDALLADTPTPTLVSSATETCGLRPQSRMLGRLTTEASKKFTRSVRKVHHGSDVFYNYDFDENGLSAGEYNLTRPDQPVNLIFWGNARTPDQVKLYTFGTSVADPMYMRMNEGRGWIWDRDSGSKDKPPGCWTSTHYRVYKDDSVKDAHFTTDWGFYIIGTSHLDRIEAGGCGFWEKWVGKSEDAEHRVATEAATRWGDNAVREDVVQMYNREGPYHKKNSGHFYDNSGKATKIKVCVDRLGNNINCSSRPLNDDFADSQWLPNHRGYAYADGTLTNATVESVERSVDRLTWDTKPTRTVWYNWTSPFNTSDNGCHYPAPRYVADTRTPNWELTDLELSAWKGSDFSPPGTHSDSLKLVDFGRELELPATPGVTYYIQVANNPANPDGEDFTINVRADVICYFE